MVAVWLGWSDCGLEDQNLLFRFDKVFYGFWNKGALNDRTGNIFLQIRWYFSLLDLERDLRINPLSQFFFG